MDTNNKLKRNHKDIEVHITVDDDNNKLANDNEKNVECDQDNHE